MADDVIGLRIRLPPGLHQLLQETARRNNRSLNSEMLWRLAHSLSIEGHNDAPEYVGQMADFQRKAMDTVLANLRSKRLTKEQLEKASRRRKGK